MRARLTRPGILAGFLLGSATASAQEIAPLPPRAADTSGPRFRFGVGGHTGAGLIGNVPGFGLGFYVRGGVQITDLVGIDLGVSAGTVLLFTYARASLMADFTPLDWLSLGVGPMVGTTAALSFGDGGSSAGVMGGVSTRVGFNLRTTRYPSGVRSALTLGLEADLGYGDDAASPVSGGAYLFLGYSRF